MAETAMNQHKWTLPLDVTHHSRHTTPQHHNPVAISHTFASLALLLATTVNAL